MLTNILEQKANLMNKHWRYVNFEVHMNIDDYHRLLADVTREGNVHYLRYDAGCNYIYGMNIVIDDSEKPCVNLAD